MSALLPLLLAAASLGAQPVAEAGADDAAPPAASSAAGRPITLGEAYRLALARTETIAASSDAVQAALALVDELESDILPHFALAGTETLQQNPNSGIASLDRTSTPQFQLQVTQPIFSGFREFLAFDMAKSSAAAAGYAQRRAEEALYQSVAQAYFSLQELQNEARIRREIIDVTQGQTKQLERWIRIGRSRRSELLATQAQLAQDRANVEIAAGQERVAQELLRFLTGLDQELVPQPEPVPDAGPEREFLARAEMRADVQAARKNADVARLNAKIAGRQRWPLIGFTGDYYLVRTGFLQSTHYDGIFSASLPIWDFGTISNQVRQAKAFEDAARQAESFAERTARNDVRSAYASFTYATRAVAALKKAADANQASYEAQVEDYRNGLVTNLDVLNSLNTLEATRLSLSQQLQQQAYTRAQLEVAAGSPRSLP